MSHVATVWAWEQNVGSPMRKLVLLHMADSANPESGNQTWWSLASIAKRCCASRSAIQSAVTWLVENDYLTLVRASTRQGQSNRYRLNVGTVTVGQGPARAVPEEEHPVPADEQGLPPEEHPVPSEKHPVPAGGKEPVIQPVTESSCSAPREREEPLKPLDWAQHFIAAHGYSMTEAQTARTMSMFARWIGDGVTAADVETAFNIATARTGSPPRTPAYLDGIVADVRAEAARPAPVAANDARGNVATFRRAPERRLSPEEFATRMVEMAAEDRRRVAGDDDAIEHDPAGTALAIAGVGR